METPNTPAHYEKLYMRKHILNICQPAEQTPSTALPDGAITGNGDLTAVLAGTADRVRIYIGKADFWKADERAYVEHRGGIAPLGLAELLLPQLAYAEYRAEQNMDEAYIALRLTAGKQSATLKITVCATENTILLELEHTHPAVSASLSLLPLTGSEAITEQGTCGEVSYSLRGFDDPEFRFPTYGVCALKTVSRTVSNGTERIVWAISVRTNHDTAAYKNQAIERAADIDLAACERLITGHAEHWKRFWAKSGVSLPDPTIENYWYAGIYSVACCSGNKRFPPGLWGAYATSDSMGWFGDYHLNYNYEAPFYALASSNHPELLECYTSPLRDFLPRAKRYAKEYPGISGAYFPVGIGPLGMETDLRPETKEHGHLFLGQKSNGAYAAVIPMMHWYSTRDADFAEREYYDFLLAVTDFWENYLVFEDGVYQIYNDALNEVGWYEGSDHMPEGHDDKNPILSLGLVKMLMKLMIDLSRVLGRDTHRIPKWQHIIDHLPAADTFEVNGETLLRGIDGSDELRELCIEYIYPVGAVGKYGPAELFKAARNTHRRLGIWDSHNRFCSYYPGAARLEYSPDEIISHIKEVIGKRALPNGMFRYMGGGLENSAAIPASVNEMLLQSFEGVLRLFPCWNRAENASFFGLRAYGAFVVNAELRGGAIKAEVLSEKGQPLRLESPGKGYAILKDGETIPINEPVISLETRPGMVLKIVLDKTAVQAL